MQSRCCEVARSTLMRALRRAFAGLALSSAIALGIAACGDDGRPVHGNGATAAGGHVPTVPGLRGGAEHVLAQGFGAARREAGTPASDALLPPVMHGAE